jgi:hypothetical protein
MDICIDFDGTCVTHEFPKVGQDIGAAPVLKRLVANGHNLILFTMRGNRAEAKDTGDPTIMDVTGMFLDDAIDWFKRNEIPLYGINEHPTQKNWTNSPKAYAQLYIDDAALGCPLIYCDSTSARPYANWVKIEHWLEKEGFIRHMEYYEKS